MMRSVFMSVQRAATVGEVEQYCSHEVIYMEKVYPGQTHDTERDTFRVNNTTIHKICMKAGLIVYVYTDKMLQQDFKVVIQPDKLKKFFNPINLYSAMNIYITAIYV